MEAKVTNMKTSQLELNTGQIPGVPKNPRFIRDARFAALKKSIEDAPEMLTLRELIVYPLGKKYVVICGNMRLRACREIGYKELPCKVLQEETPPEKLREYAIKDNNGFGEDDWDLLANEWDADELKDWGIELPTEWGGTEDDLGVFDDDGGTDETELNEEAERLLNDAMRENVTEFKAQIDHTMQKGFIASGMTRGWAKAQFLRALYYGKRYPQKCAYVYSPELFFLHNANDGSYYTVMERIINGATAGIAGFRHISSDGILTRAISDTYNIAGGGGGGDFPSDLARKLIEEYAPKGCRVLDPCHGWGGRLVGAMLAGASEYVGCDPSPVAHRAVIDIYNDFSPYVDTKARLVYKPYEQIAGDEIGGQFDIALTSPPYFDVEKYDGEETSTRLYPDYELWCEKFYKPLIENTVRRLKKGGCFLLQVGSQVYKLREKAIEICNVLGYKSEIIGTDIFTSNLGKEDCSNKEDLLKITR